MLNNISLRIFLPLIFVFVAIIVFVSYYFVALPIGYQQAINETEDKFSARLASIQGRYNNLLSTDNIIAVNQDMIMTANDDLESVKYIMIMDEDYTVLYSSETSHVGLGAGSLPFGLNQTLSDRSHSTGLVSFEREKGTSNLIGYAGLKYFNVDGAQKNTLIVVLDIASVAEKSLEVTWDTLLIVFTFLIVVGLGMTVLTHYKIHKRAQILLQMARNIGENTQVGNVKLEGFDELGKLGVELEKMAEMLALREKRLRHLRHQAEKVSESKSTFLSTMSHEIRTPLTGLIGFLELSTEKFKEQDTEQYLDISLQSAKSLLSLVNEILDLSRLENNRVQVEEKPILAYDLFNSVLNSQMAVAKQKDLYLDLQFDGDKSAIVETDVKLMSQVLMNLLTNALKFTHSGGITLSVKMTEGEGDVYRMMIKMKDTGIGIEADQIDRLFNRYEQIEEAQSAASHAGTGLGLAIVKEIARLLRLNITVDSVVGEGTTFSMRTVMKMASKDAIEKSGLEIGKTAEPFIKPASITSDTEDKSEAAYRGNIMIVDDNQVNRLLISKLVDPMVEDYFTLPHGEAAIVHMQKVKERQEPPVDMILMDINMPGLNGDEVQKEIRKLSDDFADLPIIAITANTIKGAREEYLTAGMTDFISKPIEREGLYQLLNKYLQPFSGAISSENVGVSESIDETKEAPAQAPMDAKQKAMADLLADL